MVFTPVSLPIFWTNSFALAQHLIDSYLSNLCPCKIDRYPLFSDHMHLKFQLLLTYHKKFSSAKYLISILEPFASWFLVYLYSSHLFPSKSFNCGQEKFWLTRSTGSLSTIYSFLSTCFLQSRGLITVIPIWLIGLTIIIITFNTKSSYHFHWQLRYTSMISQSKLLEKKLLKLLER